MTAIKAILFDLDDTLIASDMKTFLPHYFRALTAKLAHLVPPQKLIDQLLHSTSAMMADDHPSKTNQQVFFENFFPRIGIGREILSPLFDDFYQHDFGQLRDLTQVKPEAREIVSGLFARGYEVIIATQPVFPLTAIRQRLEWGGVGDFPYRLITSYENRHFSKPSISYFREILRLIGRQPPECLMVGNDFDHDILPATKIGMKTFWVTEAAPQNPEWPAEADYSGTLSDLGRLVES